MTRTQDQLFSPEPKDKKGRGSARPWLGPPPPCRPDPAWPVPTDEECFDLWDRYAMPEHIREHSLAVAEVAGFIARKLLGGESGARIQEVRASALLHDLAKSYTIRHGGRHDQLGGVWTARETGNPLVAQGVAHHVFWPWEVDARAYLLPLAVIYGDKRVRHNQIVSVEERFEDLVTRYGKNDFLIERIGIGKRQAVLIEQTFSQELGIDLNAHPFDSRRLVQRA